MINSFWHSYFEFPEKQQINILKKKIKKIQILHFFLVFWFYIDYCWLLVQASFCIYFFLKNRFLTPFFTNVKM
jgi:hypothetical protein